MYSNLEDYEYLYGITTLMRTAATQGKWDQLNELENLCREHITIMQQRTMETKLNEALRMRKVDLIRKILANDAAIRNYTCRGWLN